MKKLTSILLIISVIILVVIVIVSGLIILRGEEDTWICSAGGWVKHGNPSAQMPSKSCPSQKACTLEAKICPDGSAVGRGGPNCEFGKCPGTLTVTSTVTINQKSGKNVFTNSHYGYTFEFPSGYITINKEGSVILSSVKIMPQDGGSDVPTYVQITSQNINDIISLEKKFLVADITKPKFTEQKIVVSGVEATKLSFGPTESFNGDSVNIYFSHNGLTYIVSWNSLTDKLVLDSILSTFKFTK